MDSKDKIYGEINHSDLEKYQYKFDTVNSELVDLKKEFYKLKDPNKWNQIFPSSSDWTSIYLLSYPEHLILFFHTFGLLESVLATMQTDNTNTKIKVIEFLESLDEYTEDDLPNDQSLDSAFVVFYPLMKSLTSWMNYGKTLSTLVQEASEGNNKSLFKAVRVDRAIIACPPIAHRIAKAEMKGDERFFKKPRNALTGKLLVNTNLDTFRFLILALNEAGGLSSLSENERYQLFCEELNVYPYLDKEDPSAALKMFISRWLKEAESFVT